jgi:hypothetical protein
MLPEADQRLLHGRARRNRFGRFAVPLALVVWLTFFTWLFFRVPLLGNPIYVVGQLQRDALAPGVLVTMASMLPVAVCLVSILVIVFLLLACSWVRLERRYLEALRRAADRNDPA